MTNDKSRNNNKIVTNNKSLNNSNALKHVRLKTEELLNQVLKDDFYGSISLEMTITEGIVRNIKTNITRSEFIERRKT